MTTLNNPAGRLYDILFRVLFLKAGNQRMKHVWAQIFLIQKSDEIGGDDELDEYGAQQILYHVSEVIKLVEECKKLIRKNPEIDQELHLEPFLVAGTALSTLNLEETWEQFISRLPQDSVNAIRYTSETFSKNYTEEVIEREILEELLSDIAELLKKVVKADLAEDLKELLTASLENMRLAILGYMIRGSGGLKAALDQGLGAAVRFRDEMDGIPKKRDRNVVTEFFSFFTKVDGLVATSLKVKQLAHPLVQLMLPGSSDS